jgi:hypothetical protein
MGYEMQVTVRDIFTCDLCGMVCTRDRSDDSSPVLPHRWTTLRANKVTAEYRVVICLDCREKPIADVLDYFWNQMDGSGPGTTDITDPELAEV